MVNNKYSFLDDIDFENVQQKEFEVISAVTAALISSVVVIVFVILIINIVVFTIIHKRKRRGITIDNNSHALIPFTISFKILSGSEITEC